LRILNLSFNQIKEIKNLDSLNELRELSIYRNKIEGISGLGNLVNLRRLIIYHNNITKILNLNNLKKLEFLDKNLNKILSNLYQNIALFIILLELSNIYLINPEFTYQHVEKFIRKV